MDKGLEQTFQRRYTNNQQSYKKMLNINNVWDNAKPQQAITLHLLVWKLFFKVGKNFKNLNSCTLLEEM